MQTYEAVVPILQGISFDRMVLLDCEDIRVGGDAASIGIMRALCVCVCVS